MVRKHETTPNPSPLARRGVGIACGLALAATAHGATVVLQPATKYQKISGFGASTAWGSTFSNSGDPDLLWSTTSGAGLSLHRIHVDPSSGSTSELNIAKKAVSYGVRVWATPWTPPAKFKSNNSTVMGNLTKPAEYAQYLVDFVKNMKNNGVDIYAISAQNEPDANVTYESCVFNGSTMATWVGKSLGPAFAGTGVKVMAAENQNWYGLNTFWPLMKADADFMKYADIIATHEYGGAPGDGTFANTINAIKTSGKEFWQTEIYDTQGPADPGMGSGLRTYKLIHECMTIANMSAWHFWWVYPSTTDNGALWDKATNKATKRLWVMGNFSRFVRPGYMRIGTTGSPASGITLSAYSSDSAGKLVIVAANNNSSATSQDFSVSGTTVTGATPWVTDDSRNLVAGTKISVSGNAFTYSLPAKSVTTLVLDAQSASVRPGAAAPIGLRAARTAAGIRLDWDSRQAGTVQLITLDGRVAASRAFPAGTSGIVLPEPPGAAVLEARVVQGDRSDLTEIVTTR